MTDDAHEALKLARPYVAHHDDNQSFPTHTSNVLAKIDAALAQYDAEERLLPGLKRAASILQQYWEPPGAIVPAFDDIQNEIKRIDANPATLTQSNAEKQNEQLRDIIHQMNCDLMDVQSDAERIRELEAECGRFENALFEARAALAQFDAEPVAWQYRWKMELFDGGKEWSSWHDLPHGHVERYAELPEYETRPLYTAPPLAADRSGK